MERRTGATHDQLQHGIRCIAYVLAAGVMPSIQERTVRKMEMVTIPKEEYEQLLRDRELLSCLEGHGVDNWSGYSDAFEEFQNGGNEE
jgi:hypothetical protein